jgi:hypothetical protein
MNEDSIIVALEEQVGCYKRLAKLAEVQHEHVQQSQTEGLLQVLGLRQEVLDDISALEERIAPAKGRWIQYLGELDEPSRGKAQQLLAESRRLLEQITSADRDDAMVLQQRKANLSQAIHQTSAARQVNRNYAAAAYGRRPSRMDVRQ